MKCISLAVQLIIISVTPASALVFKNYTASCASLYSHCMSITAPVNQFKCDVVYDYAKRTQVWASDEALSKIQGGHWTKKFCN